MIGLALRRLVPVVIALSSVGCFDLQPDPPAGPSKFQQRRATSITIEYRQPAHCATVPDRCNLRVVFFGSWMGGDSTRDPEGEGVTLDYDPHAGPYFWTGTAHNVPVNWPPTDEPHYVRVWDPHLEQTPTAGATAARLIVGGQVITDYDDLGTPLETGKIYVDDNGVGRRPY